MGISDSRRAYSSCSQYGGMSPGGSRSKTKNDNRVDKWSKKKLMFCVLLLRICMHMLFSPIC